MLSTSLINSQTIHIGAEILVISGLTIFLKSNINKNKKRIEELEETIANQQDFIIKHENLLLQLVNTVNLLNEKINILETQNAKLSMKKNKNLTEESNDSSSNEFVLDGNFFSAIPLQFNFKNEDQKQQTESKVEELPNEIEPQNIPSTISIDEEKETEEEKEIDADLDDELEEELKDLN